MYVILSNKIFESKWTTYNMYWKYLNMFLTQFNYDSNDSYLEKTELSTYFLNIILLSGTLAEFNTTETQIR